MNTNTNPPAFPFVAEDDTGMMINMGMTLRDYFAAKAMQGFISGDYDVYPHEAAQKAYEIADAMMKARGE
jgi:hypothetical protein